MDIRVYESGKEENNLCRIFLGAEQIHDKVQAIYRPPDREATSGSPEYDAKVTTARLQPSVCPVKNYLLRETLMKLGHFVCCRDHFNILPMIISKVKHQAMSKEINQISKKKTLERNRCTISECFSLSEKWFHKRNNLSDSV
jgi:hypothetical protein